MTEDGGVSIRSGRLATALAELGRSAPDRLVDLLAAGNDIALFIDAKGVIRDIAAADPGIEADSWLGRAWLDTVTIESVAKITEMRVAASNGDAPRWRQVNHPSPEGDIPVRYRLTGVSGGAIAIGRDLRAAARAQQQLLQAQQSLEREYLNLRQAEQRYRLLFDLSQEAALIVDANTRRIREANPAAHRLLRAKPGGLVNQPVASIVAAGDAEAFIAHLAQAEARDGVPARFALGRSAEVLVSAAQFRQDRAAYLLVRLAALGGADAPAESALDAVVEHMPDAFVLTDDRLTIVEANTAFVDLAGAPSAARLARTPLGDWLGRAGIDLELVAGQLREHGAVRNVGTFVRSASKQREEVELSGVRVDNDGTPMFGFVLRPVARRLRDLPPVEKGASRSVEQLTELVGRVSLKEIVRESTDVIERLCIEAALTYTSDNRASAAEILGLSRQSLYSKLHRHRLGVGSERDEPVQSD